MNSLKYLSLVQVFNSFNFEDQKLVISDLIKSAGIITFKNVDDKDYLDENSIKISKFLFRITKLNEITKSDVYKANNILNILMNLSNEGIVNHNKSLFCFERCNRKLSTEEKVRRNVCCYKYIISRSNRNKEYFKINVESKKEEFFKNLLSNASDLDIIVNGNIVSFIDLINDDRGEHEFYNSEWNNKDDIANTDDLIYQNKILEDFIKFYLGDYYINNNYDENNILCNIIKENNILKRISLNQIGLDFYDCNTKEIEKLISEEN